MFDLIAVSGVDLNSLVEGIQASTEYPWLQGWLTAVATFFFENIVCWTIVPPLISEHILGWMTAFYATFFGVFIGDILMYLPVRFAMRYIIRLRWFQRHQQQVEMFGHFFDRHLGKTMFIIRFTPGIRTFALIAAGMLRVNLAQYTLFSALSCALQSALVVFFMPTLYAPIIAWLKGLWVDYPVLVIGLIVVFLGLFCVVQYIIAKMVMRHLSHTEK